MICDTLDRALNVALLDDAADGSVNEVERDVALVLDDDVVLVEHMRYPDVARLSQEVRAVRVAIPVNDQVPVLRGGRQ